MKPFYVKGKSENLHLLAEIIKCKETLKTSTKDAYVIYDAICDKVFETRNFDLLSLFEDNEIYKLCDYGKSKYYESHGLI